MQVSNDHLLVFCWLTEFFAAIGPASRLLLGNNKMAIYLFNGSGLSNLQEISTACDCILRPNTLPYR